MSNLVQWPVAHRVFGSNPESDGFFTNLFFIYLFLNVLKILVCCGVIPCCRVGYLLDPWRVTFGSV